MASKEGEGSQPSQAKAWVLKVSIHCEGCKKKVKKILNNIPGVHDTEIDSRQNKVTVIGEVDAETLIKRLAKSGKQAILWPTEKKPNNPNPNPSNNGGKEKSKEEEKVAPKPTQPSETPEKKPEISAATTSSEADTQKPAETATKPKSEAAEAGNKEGASKSEPELKPEKEQDKGKVKETIATSSDTATKPADTDTKVGSSGKKKGKKVVEGSSHNEDSAMHPNGVRSIHQNPMYQIPQYPQPVYATSYNMVRPMPSYSYYATPDQGPTPQTYVHSVPPQLQSYVSSGHPPPPMQQSYAYSGHPPPEYSRHVQPPPQSYAYSGPPPEYSRHAQPPPEYYPHESYYTPMEPPLQSQGHTYDYFSDENANSCSVM